MEQFKLQKYSLLETFFSEYKIIRKLSGAFWVKLHEDGYQWVKFDKKQFEKMKFLPSVKFSIEDYTK